MIFAQTGLPINPSDFISDPAIALLVIVLMAAIVGVIRGWWVPRFIYDEQVKRADKTTELNEKLVDSFEDFRREMRAERQGGAR